MKILLKDKGSSTRNVDVNDYTDLVAYAPSSAVSDNCENNYVFKDPENDTNNFIINSPQKFD